MLSFKRYEFADLQCWWKELLEKDKKSDRLERSLIKKKYLSATYLFRVMN